MHPDKIRVVLPAGTETTPFVYITSNDGVRYSQETVCTGDGDDPNAQVIILSRSQGKIGFGEFNEGMRALL